MIRLLYMSQARPSLTGDQIQKIRHQAAQDNQNLEITGLFILGGGVFAQILEGPEANVLRLYLRIMDDPRHHDCRLVHISPIKTRLFDKWFMSVIEATPLELEHLASLRAYREEAVEPSAFTSLMKKFLEQLNAE